MKENKDFKILLIYANLMLDNVIPLNISSLSASLKKGGFSVKLFDTTFYRTQSKSSDKAREETLQIRPFNYTDYGILLKSTDIYQDLREMTIEFQPDLIGLSVVEATCHQGLKLINSISDFGIPVIVGGIHAIFSAEDIIQEKNIDMVCFGEGEKTLVDLAKALKDGKNYTLIKNLYVKKEGKIYRNSTDELLDLDKLPFKDFSIFEKERFFRPMAGKIYKMVPVEFSRGCPYSCTYCANEGLADMFQERGSWYRMRSVDAIIEEIKNCINVYGVNYFYFVSESFLNVPKKRFYDFIEQYSQIKIPFWFNTRLESITDEKLTMLEKINCHRISVGIESGNEYVRSNLLNRKVSNQTIIDKFEIIRNHKIPVSVNNIIGFPGETREQIFDTIELNRKVQADNFGAYIFTPYRGTSLRRLCVDRGYVSKGALVGNLHLESSMDTEVLTGEELRGLARTFVLYVKLPKSEWPKIKVAEKFDQEGNIMFERLKKVYYENYF